MLICVSFCLVHTVAITPTVKSLLRAYSNHHNNHNKDDDFQIDGCFTVVQVINLLDDNERQAYSKRITEYFGERSKQEESSDESDDGEWFDLDI